MTATASPAGAPGPEHHKDRGVAALMEAITPTFAATLGWTPHEETLRFPQDHPLLGSRPCQVGGCDNLIVGAVGRLCQICKRQWRAAGQPPLEEFLAACGRSSPARHASEQLCSVTDCQRPQTSPAAALCAAHEAQRRHLALDWDDFLSDPRVTPHEAFGPCQVLACSRSRMGAGPYCGAHRIRWKDTRRRDPGLDEHKWRQTTAPVWERSIIGVRALPPRLVAEFVYGLEQRCAENLTTDCGTARALLDKARARQAGSLADVPEAALRGPSRLLRNYLVKTVERFGSHPDAERIKDNWDLVVFGHHGVLNFREITQPWLREAAKVWAFEEMPRRRGDHVGAMLSQGVRVLDMLSESLHRQRVDHGLDPRSLDRSDIVAFLNWLAALQSSEAFGAARRQRICQILRRILNRMRTLGLVRHGGVMAGLPGEFVLTREDIPDAPEPSEAGKDLPAGVLRQLCNRLDDLEATSGPEVRTAVELLIDTGRRPNEIATLAFDCLDRDPDGRPVLVYNNHKEHKLARRLPIPEPTAAVVIAQQQRIRARFADLSIEGLKLLPSSAQNPEGRKNVSVEWISECHRAWVNSFAEFTVPGAAGEDGHTVTRTMNFAKSRIYPYAYRHSYAQRHADAGVDVGGLANLLDHDDLGSAQVYYRVTEKRRREAVDRVTAMQFDRHGNRIWRQAEALLESERVRRAVGEVAVPYGGCTEPGNVAAGGQDCPVRYRCVGCGHFRTDVSYLPDLEAYLADLRRNRERLLASVGVDEWAKAEAMPSDEEIYRVQVLIGRVKADLDQLDEADHARIEDAVATVRRARNGVVGLGLPQVRPTLPELRPERPA